MICPNCKSEYTSVNPCHCDTYEALLPPASNHKPETENGSDRTAPALAPTGIKNPFWH